jgi:hypothetical protein
METGRVLFGYFADFTFFLKPLDTIIIYRYIHIDK